MKEKNIILLAILVVIVVLSIGFLYVRNIKQSGPWSSFCKAFQYQKGEIQCADAIQLALQSYPGEIKNIARKENDSPERAGNAPSFWLVRIMLEEPIVSEKLEKTAHIAIVKVNQEGNADLYELAE